MLTNRVILSEHYLLRCFHGGINVLRNVGPS
jgi:hypothetical protein